MSSSLPPRPPVAAAAPAASSSTSPSYQRPFKRQRQQAPDDPPSRSTSAAPGGGGGEVYTLKIPGRSSPLPAKPVDFQQPTCFTTYSVTAPPKPNAHRQPHFSLSERNSCLARYSPCPLGADLSYGFERCTWTDEERKAEEGLDDLCEAVWRFERDSLGGGRVLTEGKEGFVSFRGTLTKLLTAPYDTQLVELSAQMVRGNIYLEQHQSTPRRMVGAEREMRLTYNGFSFESYSTTPYDVCPHPAPSEPPVGPPTASSSKVEKEVSVPEGWSGDVDLNEEWCALVKTSLDGNRLILGGEVDCLEGEFTGSLANSVELKTSVQPVTQGQINRFELKLLRFWAQSFLLGTPTIVVGFRQQDPPEVMAVQRMETRLIPRMVRPPGWPERAAPWEAQRCLAFGGEVLSFLRRTMSALGEEDEQGRARLWSVRLERGWVEVRCMTGGGDEWEGRVRERKRGRGKRWGILPAWMQEGKKDEGGSS